MAHRDATTQEAQVRAAMERLLTGRAIHAGERLDVVGLAEEAGVSRQDLYRHHRALLEEFRSHRQRLEAHGAGGAGRNAKLERLRAELAQAHERAVRYRAERDAARAERDANASQVAYLHLQNRLLREQIDAERRVRSLPGRG